MTVWELGDQRFEVVIASDAQRDGLALELTALDDRESGPSLEAFFSDRDGQFTFHARGPASLPFEIVERFIQMARRSLPPSKMECPACGAAELNEPPYETWPPPTGVTLEPPYEAQLGSPSYEVCPNCGFEFGNDDNPGTARPVSFEEYKAEWIAEGRPRFDRD